MAKGGGGLDDLYQQILSSLDNSGPNLQLTADLPPNTTSRPSIRPSMERRGTEGSEGEKFMDIYDSYTEPDVLPAGSSGIHNAANQDTPPPVPSKPRIPSGQSFTLGSSQPQFDTMVVPPPPPLVHSFSRPLPRPPPDMSSISLPLPSSSGHQYQFTQSSRESAIFSARARQLPQPNIYRQTLVSPTSIESDFDPILNGNRPNTVHVDSNLSASSTGTRTDGPSDGLAIDPKGAGSQVTAQRAVSGRRRPEDRRKGMLQPLPPDLGIRSPSPGQASIPGDRYDGSVLFNGELGKSQYVDGNLPESSSSNGSSSYVGGPYPMTPSSGASSRTPYSEDDSYLFSGTSTTNGTSMTSHTARPSISSMTRPIDPESDYDFVDDFPDPDDSEEDFLNTSLLSHIAVKLRDKVPRGTHVKGSIPYPNAFTGKDIVSTIQSVIQRDLPDITSDGRQTALQVARSLKDQLFFYEVEWGDCVLYDGVEDVFMFLDEPEADGGGLPEREELPTGVVLSLTKCYASTCGDDNSPCYLYSCPRRARPQLMHHVSDGPIVETVEERGWADGIDPAILKALSTSEINRQTVIAKTINQEAQYIKDLDLIDSLFVKPLRRSPEPIIAPEELDSFIDVVFGNIFDLRETNRRLLEVMFVRQREQGPFIQRIGDIFLTASVEFRVVYPLYVGNLPLAEKRVKDEVENNPKFRVFLEQCARVPESRRLELRHFITRPSEHLQQYPVLLEAIRTETSADNPDAEYLLEASGAIRKLSTVAQLWTFQSSITRGQPSKLEWHDLVPADMLEGIPKAERKRQAVIFELIKGEMEYVRDLELIRILFIHPLQSADLQLPDSSERGMEEFLREIFHNYDEVLRHHRRLLDSMHEVQREEHPCITSIVAPLYDATLNWEDVYMEYVSHYPVAHYRVDEAMSKPAFRKVVEDAQRNPDAQRFDIKLFIYRPIARILRYNLLLDSILKETPEGHTDQQLIPEVSERIRALGKSMDHSIDTAKRKVEMWRYNKYLAWKPGEEIDLDLLDETRTLVHAGRLLRQPEGGMEWNSWSEVFVLLFDHYLVMAKTKEKDGVTRYHINRRPVPLELLTLVSFSESPQQRSSSLLGNFRGGRNTQHADGAPNGEKAEQVDSRLLYPCSIHHSGRVGGHYHLFAESAQARAEWERKLNEAVVLRKAVQDANQVFEKRTISMDTFVVPSLQTPMLATYDGTLTGKVACSIPLKTSDGVGLIAVGCAEGVWIGLRHDSRSMRRVLHLKQVTQCAMLEEFGIFLVLADKSLFAYHIEALVPTGPSGANSQPRQPQKLNGSRDVQFFSVGTLQGRTLIIYMKKKGLDSVFRVLEPVTGKISEKAKTTTFSRNIFGPKQPEWFRVYREFFLPSESFDLYFLKARVAILCTKGFEVMDLTDLNSITIPHSEDPRHGALIKRCESCKPMGIFRCGENEFFLCYDEFGLYVDRHGEPSRSPGVVEWEGTAERVASHFPYILIFDTRFIEVRDMAKGKLVQIIPGTDVHCTWDGRGYFTAQTVTSPSTGGWDERTPGEATVHAVMKAEEVPDASARASPQHLFELAPTQLLYAPPAPSMSSPVGYIPRKSSSPPHSPRPSSLSSGWTK